MFKISDRGGMGCISAPNLILCIQDHYYLGKLWLKFQVYTTMGRAPQNVTLYSFILSYIRNISNNQILLYQYTIITLPNKQSKVMVL